MPQRPRGVLVVLLCCFSLSISPRAGAGPEDAASANVYGAIRTNVSLIFTPSSSVPSSASPHCRRRI